MPETIEYEKDGHTAYLRFNRPSKGNAISWEMWSDVGEALHDADDDDDIRSIIVTGNGTAFCTGGDLDDLLPGMSSSEVELRPENPREDMMLRQSEISTPIIAAVNGHCLAGGLEFLQATDIRVAEAQAEFGLPEVSWGLIPGGGTHTRLPRQIPYVYAMEAILTGRKFSAEEAHQMGIVNTVVDDGGSVAKAEEYAATINDNGPRAIQQAKEIVHRGLNVPMEQSFRLEEAMAKEVIEGAEAQEGLAAFAEGREPQFDTDVSGPD